MLDLCLLSRYRHSSLGQFHDGLDHIVVGLSENSDSSVSCAVSVIHDHGDVVWSKSLLWKWLTIILWGFDGIGGFGGWSLLSEFLGLFHLHLSVQILEFELTEDSIRVIKVKDLWIINDEDESISLFKSNSGDSTESFHTNFDECFSAFLLVLTKIKIAPCRL